MLIRRLLSILILWGAASFAGASDVVPPPLAKFVARAGIGNNTLTWIMPDYDITRGVVIRYAENTYPISPEDGSPVENNQEGRFDGGPGDEGTFTHHGLTNGQYYYYSAFVFDFNNDYSERTRTQARVGDTDAPAQPAMFNAESSDGAVLLEWENPRDSDLNGVVIRYQMAGYPSSPDDGLPVENGSGGYFTGRQWGGPGASKEFLHEGLVNGTSHFYAAFALDLSNNIETHGARAKATPIDAAPPQPVTDFTVSAGDSRLMLRWTNPGDDDFEGTMLRFSPTTIPGTVEEGEPVPNGEGGLFHGEPGSVDSFAHRPLENGVTYNYAAFAFDEVPWYSIAIAASGTTEDGTPPQVTLGVLQNPLLPAKLDIYIVGSEPLDGDASLLIVSGDTLAVTVTDREKHVWKGDWDLAGEETLRIIAVVSDLAGNRGGAELQFTPGAAVRSAADE